MSEFDANRLLFNCDNGTIELQPFCFREHRAEDFITKISPVVYDPNARSPRFIKFVKEIMSDDMKKVKFLQKTEGYGITGETLYECMFIHYGPTTRTLTYDEIIKLFFSLKAEYRKKGVWLMNDSTALTLRTLKDNDGNYLWNQDNDTIIGKPVCISEYMPNAESGSKAIAFGDLSYYWIVNRRPLAVRTLAEKYTLYSQTGYLAYEFLDGKLIRPEAIKVLKIQ